MREAERAARWAGAKTKTSRSRPRVDPELAQRATEAVTRATGLRARVANGRMEIPFEDEHELAEIAEIFERLNP